MFTGANDKTHEKRLIGEYGCPLRFESRTSRILSTSVIFWASSLGMTNFVYYRYISQNWGNLLN